MSTNKDGLEPGQSVDFATLQRIERQRGTKQDKPTTKEGEKRGRKTTKPE